MLKKIYIHNYKCFQNFEFNLDYEKTVLLLGKNGAGKSTLLNMLKKMQQIANNENKLGDLFRRQDFHNPYEAIDFEVLIDIKDSEYRYKLSIVYPANFREPKIQSEVFWVDGSIVYKRDEEGTVALDSSEFIIDWHSVALPVLFPRDKSSNKIKIDKLKKWLSSMLFLAPIPELIASDTYMDGRWLEKNGKNFCSWLNEILKTEPKFYSDLTQTLSRMMPDFEKFKFEDYGVFKQLNVVFSKDKARLELPFEALSDGEKLFFIFSAVITLSTSEDRCLFCFWDEPENYISLAFLYKLINFVRAKFEFSKNNQLFFSSHNPEIINSFPNSNIYYLYRDGHLSPSRIRSIQDGEDVVELLKYGEVA